MKPKRQASPIQIDWLGRKAYEPMLAMQEAEVEARAAVDHGLPDRLLLLEHEPVFTLGRTPNSESLPSDVDLLPAPLHRINRGGEATYHGPGQLIGYPILDLRRRKQDLHVYLRTLEQVLIDFLADYGVTATRREAYTGVWVGDKKVASIGVGVRRWVTFHGFALIVEDRLEAFQAITPCGIRGVEMSSLSACAGKLVTVQQAASAFAEAFPARLEQMLPTFA